MRLPPGAFAIFIVFAEVATGIRHEGIAAPRIAESYPAECGWVGVGVRPMTSAVADSLGMSRPYGAIFERPAPGSPAAEARIEAGDVLTQINGSPLVRSSDFDPFISMRAPGTMVYFTTYRNRQLIELTLVLGSSTCPAQNQRRNQT